MLMKMGSLQDASKAYSKALDISNLPFSLEHKDFPALYAAADAYEGMGKVAAAEARRMRDPAAKSKLWNDARAAYQKSLNTWEQIPNPSRINPNGYLAGDPRQVEQLLQPLTTPTQHGN